MGRARKGKMRAARGVLLLTRVWRISGSDSGASGTLVTPLKGGKGDRRGKDTRKGARCLFFPKLSPCRRVGRESKLQEMRIRSVYQEGGGDRKCEEKRRPVVQRPSLLHNANIITNKVEREGWSLRSRSMRRKTASSVQGGNKEKTGPP